MLHVLFVVADNLSLYTRQCNLLLKYWNTKLRLTSFCEAKIGFRIQTWPCSSLKGLCIKWRHKWSLETCMHIHKCKESSMLLLIAFVPGHFVFPRSFLLKIWRSVLMSYVVIMTFARNKNDLSSFLFYFNPCCFKSPSSGTHSKDRIRPVTNSESLISLWDFAWNLN